MTESVQILLVEDSDADAELALRALRDRKLTMTRVRDGLEAIEYLFCEGAFAGRDRTLPNLLLLDLKMPRVNGMDLLRTLKSDALTKNIAVIILSSSATKTDAAMASTMGAHRLLEKPTDSAAFSDLLQQVVDAWIESRGVRT
jgi:CheY-like chemotaxis protein